MVIVGLPISHLICGHADTLNESCDGFLDRYDTIASYNEERI